MSKAKSVPVSSAHTRRREVVLLLCWVLAVALAAVLFSYDVQDPAWNYLAVSENVPVQNYGGRFGAWMADIAFFLFGYLAWALPLLLVAVGVVTWRGRYQGGAADRRVHPLLRLVAGLLGACAVCALASLHQPVPEASLPVASAGGMVGHVLALPIFQSLGLMGATLLLLAVVLAGLTLLSGGSWLALMDSIGQGLLARKQDSDLERKSLRQPRPDAFSDSQESAPKPVKLPAVLPGKRKEPIVPPEAQEKPALNVQAAPEEETSAAKARRRLMGKAAATVAAVAGSAVTTAASTATAITERKPSRSAPANEGQLPPLDLLDPPHAAQLGYSDEELQQMSQDVEDRLGEFGVKVTVMSLHTGPVITRFELLPAPGVKGSQIVNLSKDLARALSVISVRVQEVIPGKPHVGLEVPNQRRDIVTLGEVLSSDVYQGASSPLTTALGKDISGNPVVADLGKMPHVLVAGTTGAGKSVAINVMLLSWLFRARPDEVRLILIDPKMLELSVYDGIPHLLTPVVTDMKDASNALRWCVGEMERRYKLMSLMGVRNLAGFNKKIKAAMDAGEPIDDPTFVPLVPDMDPSEYTVPTLEPLPYIVVTIDELSDLMLVAGKKVEELILRLAQKARAAGVHLVLATQRPSVDVITGLIRANIPSRIAFQVASKIDSRTILDQMGAEQLLGKGDMLYLPPSSPIPTRIHGAFVDDHEVHAAIAFLRQTGSPDYNEDITRDPEEAAEAPKDNSPDALNADAEADPLYDQAVHIVTDTRRASISGVQRRLRIGYNRAARLVEQMEMSGIVGALQPNGSREVLAPPPPKD